MPKRQTKAKKAATAVVNAGCSGRAINPTAVYSRHEVAEMLGFTLTHVARLRRTKGLPVPLGGRGHVLGQALLDWIAKQA